LYLQRKEIWKYLVRNSISQSEHLVIQRGTLDLSLVIKWFQEQSSMHYHFQLMVSDDYKTQSQYIAGITFGPRSLWD